jgi:hypothetical protein
MTPSEPPAGKVVYDVESAGTAPEKRAPYGDSYEWNRLERPFSQDMSYVSDLDISRFTVASDSDWWYVSLKLMGIDPNNALGINWHRTRSQSMGFGDYLIWAHPPYPISGTPSRAIYQDKNHNTGGISAEIGCAFTTDGLRT